MFGGSEADGANSSSNPFLSSSPLNDGELMYDSAVTPTITSTTEWNENERIVEEQPDFELEAMREAQRDRQRRQTGTGLQLLNQSSPADQQGDKGGGGVSRTRSSLIAELDLQDFSEEEDSEEDSSSEEDFGGRVQERKQISWSALDDDEVEEISLRILSSVQPMEEEDESDPVGVMQADRLLSSKALTTLDSEDLLGLGEIDYRNTNLVRNRGNSRGSFQHPRSSQYFGRSFSMNKKMAPHRLSTISHPNKGVKEDKSIHASSENFEPRKYLGKVHRDTSMDDLKKGLQFLKKKLSEGKDQRMLLVKENFERFIKCKNTIDDIHSRLQHNELDTSSEAASTVLLMQSMKDVKDKSSMIFQPLIERQHKRENLQSLLSTFRRYQWFLEMPSTLDEHLNNRKNDQVVLCYKKSKLFMEENPNVKLFLRVFQEIEHVIAGYKDKLYRNLESCKIDMNKAEELITTLVHLQGNQTLSQNLQKQNPFLVYLNSMSEYIVNKIAERFAKYQSSLMDEVHQQVSGPDKEEGVSFFESTLFNVLVFARENRQTQNLKMFLEYENVECNELSVKLHMGKLQSNYALTVSSILLTAMDILLHLYLEDQSMLKMLRERKDVDRANLLEIVDQAHAKLDLILEEYKYELLKLTSMSENANGLWLFMNEINVATSSVLEEIRKKNLPHIGQSQINDLNMSLTERLVHYVCAQLEKACMLTGQDAKMDFIRARRFHEENSASLSVLYIGDLLLVGLRQIIDTLSSVSEDQRRGPAYLELVGTVENSMRTCFQLCANEFEAIGEEITESMRGGDYKSDIKRVLQGLQDAHFLQNQVIPELSVLMCTLSQEKSSRSMWDTPLIESMHNLKKLYVDLNSVRTQYLQRAYLTGSMQVDSMPNKLFGVRNHVFIVLHFFVEHHSHGWQTVPHLCKELLTLLVESFLDTLSKAFHENVSKISEDEYLQSLLEISYLEKALGLYVSTKAHKSTERIRKHLFSCSRAKVETSRIDVTLTEVLERTKLHWLCFH